MKPEKKDKKPNKLEGFEVKINELGEIISNKNMDQVNKFLDKNLPDKKTKKDNKTSR